MPPIPRSARTLYNDNDPSAAAWLRGLVAAGRISKGVVSDVSVTGLRAEDAAGYNRVHLFAGIGGWDIALALAGWPADRPVWTGSCPCQPFSSAGRGLGESDPRHLWPEMRRLVGECRPPVVFGEQVASAAGRKWLAGVRADLEALGYAVGAADLCAAGAGAPHIRQRLYWVARRLADADGSGQHTLLRGRQDGSTQAVRGGTVVGLERPVAERHGRGVPVSLGSVGLAHADGGVGRRVAAEPGRGDGAGRGGAAEPGRRGVSDAVGVGNTDARGRTEGNPVSRRPAAGTGVPGSSSWVADAEGEREGAVGRVHGGAGAERGGGTGFWSRFDLVPCRDGKARRVEPGTFPLVDGVPGRVGLLRGYGNAIVPQVAAAFVRAFLDCEESGPCTG